ncbi:MAG: hypothetical protein HYU48_02900 [Candidatus Levybacteria bacterium]|nr:hypothetical protein [Candidatus Levybacteria bacterium]
MQSKEHSPTGQNPDEIAAGIDGAARFASQLTLSDEARKQLNGVLQNARSCMGEQAGSPVRIASDLSVAALSMLEAFVTANEESHGASGISREDAQDWLLHILPQMPAFERVLVDDTSGSTARFYGSFLIRNDTTAAGSNSLEEIGDAARCFQRLVALEFLIRFPGEFPPPQAAGVSPQNI